MFPKMAMYFMHLSEDTLNLCLYWYGRPMAGREYTDWLSHILIELRGADSCFSNYVVIQSTGYQPVQPDFSNFDSCVAENQPRGWAFETDGSDSKCFTMEARPKMSFANSFVTTADTVSSGCHLSVSAGSHVNFSPDCIVLQMSCDLAFPDRAERVFKTLITCAAPSFGVAIRSGVSILMAQPVKEKRVGWLTYFDASNCKLRLAELAETEVFGDGIIIRTELAPPKATESEAMNRLRTLIDELRDAGCLNKQVINSQPRKIPS